jgi:molybdopterin-binding protein
MKISARNQLEGKIKTLNVGVVNAEVVVELPGGGTITAIITKASAETLKLVVGQEAFAVVKASDVMIGVCGKGNCDCK